MKKIVRFLKNNIEEWGIYKSGEGLINTITAPPIKEYYETDIQVKLEDVKLLPPVKPTKIIGVGLNYKDHAEEFNEQPPDQPIIFIKPSSSVIGPFDKIILPDKKITTRVDYEAELAVVIKKECYKIKQEQVSDYILGYTCLNDVTARDLQKKDGQWTRAKGFNTFCPIGPFICQNIEPDNLKIQCYVNDELRQYSNTKNMIFSPLYLVYFISQIMTLYPFDVITTGTPAGIGQLKSNDTVKIEIEKIGYLLNYVE